MYLPLEHKPDNGDKIQNLANLAPGIMLQLMLIKIANKKKQLPLPQQ
jgi:hypothetical protein